VQKKISDFTYFRGTIQITGVVTAPPGGYGAYVVSALPFGGDTNAVSALLNPINCMQVDHFVMVNIASSKNFVFQLPWVDNIDFGEISDALRSWKIYVTCLKSLQTSIPGGTNGGIIQFYVNLMDDLEMVVPHFQSRKIKANKALKELAPGLHEKIGEGKGSALVGKVSGFLESVEKVPVIGAFVQPVAAAGRVVEGILDFFGFTRESQEVAPMPVTFRSVSNIARTDGPDSSDIAALTIGNSLTIDPLARGFSSEDPLACPAFFDRWTLVKMVNWMPGNYAGEVLTSVLVSPSYCIGESLGPGPGVYLTPAGYYGLTFEYWRGTMEYRIVIPTSKLHRGVLQFIWVPFNSSPDNEVTNTSMNIVFDVSTSQYIDLTIGFANKKPYLQNRLITEEMVILPLGASNGYLSIKVVNPLMAQDSLAGTNICIFAKAGKDMDFAMLRDELIYIDGAGDPSRYEIKTSLVLQSGALGDDEEEDKTSTVLVPKADPYPSADLLFGERIASIRALLQKPCNIDSRIIDQMCYFPPLFYTPGATIDAYFTYTGYFRACFVGMAASECFKIFPNAGCWLGAYPRILLGGTNINRIGALSPMTYCGQNLGAEFRIPYYGETKYLRGCDNLPNDVGRNNAIVMQNTSVDNVTTVMYHSCGPDIGATMFRQIPTVCFNSIPLGSNLWF